MGEEKLVNSIRYLVNKIIKENGPLNLFMLLKDQDNLETFTVIISSKWLDVMNAFDGTKIITKYLYDNLSTDEIIMLSRINAINTLDYQVLFINQLFELTGGITDIENCRFNMVNIPKAIIFESLSI